MSLSLYLDPGVGDHVLARGRHAHRGDVFEPDSGCLVVGPGDALLAFPGRRSGIGPVDGLEEFSGGVEDEDGGEAVVRHNHPVLLVHRDVDRLPGGGREGGGILVNSYPVILVLLLRSFSQNVELL